LISHFIGPSCTCRGFNTSWISVVVISVNKK
jgi:hypothetical protein